jgi:chromosomal replication initiation ATPase DnaA
MITEFAKRTGIPEEQVLGRGRTPGLTVARSLYWHILVINGFGYSQIGRLCGRTHSTIISGTRRARALMETGDPETVQMFERVKTIKR